MLPNGARLLVHDLPGQYVLSLRVVVRAPLAAEPPGREGVSSMTARLLDEETHRPLADQEPLIEGALLRVEPGATDVRVHASGVHGSLPRTSVRLLAR